MITFLLKSGRVQISRNSPNDLGFRWGNLMERYHVEDPGSNVRIILSWIYRKWDGSHGQD